MSLADIVGQEKAIQILRRALASGKTAHAYLFDGIPGCGKRTTALAFVGAVFCGHEDACDRCSSCLKIQNLQHPDLLLLEPDGTFIKIDQIRELQRQFSFHPYEAPKKACIIQDADRMNPAAANALLKTLEEPPGNAIIILLTSHIDGVLQTVRSRCQRLPFSAIPETTIERFLTDKGISTAQARVAASLADGSIGKALQMEKIDTIPEELRILDTVTSLTLEDIRPPFSVAEELAKDKEGAQRFLLLLQAFFRDLMILSGGAEKSTIGDLQPLIEREVRAISLDRVINRLKWISETQNALVRNVNTRLALEHLFMHMAEDNDISRRSGINIPAKQ